MTANVPIAVIGMSCRFAGDATDPQKLWRLCAEGRSAWSKIPKDRFNLDAFYHPNGQKLDTLNVLGGHFLAEDVALFDANFFNFTSDLAAAYDPQFRLQLESTYEAFESAGLSLQDVAGSNTSVFAGSFFRDYNDMNMRDPETLPRALLVGIGAAMAANRLSHFYDLRGASMTIDTGCSTTLTAFHQACQNLVSGDSDMSVVGASNVILNPDNFMVMSSSFLSEAGRSFAFDSRASGYGRGEGSATVIIKRLDDALRDGDPIRAVVRATLVNQDGKTETITTPSQEAQAKLIRECYQKAGLNPADTTYFEAHGTGTPTGDPIETRAVTSVFQSSRPADTPLIIGSVKTNIGHTETASGLASIIKVCMALEMGQIPPSINFETPNPNIHLEEWKLRVPTKLESWSRLSGIRRASVNNFGYGGSNAHVIMEDYQSFCSSRGVITNGVKNDVNGHSKATNSRIFILSAKDEQAALTMASNLQEHLQKQEIEDEEEFLRNLAYTLGQRRSILPWIGSIPAQSVSALIKGLEAGKMKPARTNTRPNIGFVFTGQGAQWHAMGRELIEAYPIFKLCVLESEVYLREFGSTWSLIEELMRDAATTNVNVLAYSTPLCAVVQIALVRLLQSWGISPTAVTSHSSGEVAAAYAAGALTLRSAMAIVFARGQMAGRTIPGVIDRKGGMVATGIGAEALEKYIARVKSGQVMVACLNSPSSTTASGDIFAVEELEEMLKADDIFARRLKIDAAYHSHHMQALSPTYLAWLQKLIKADGKMNDNVIYSSPTTGKREVSGELLSGPDHWVNSFANPVRFIEAVHAMCFEDSSSTASAVDIIIEIGPHAALGGPIQEIIALPEFHGSKISYLPSLVRKTSAVDTMHALASELIRAGYPVNTNAINFPFGRHGVRVLHDLPRYPWNHQMRHWSEPRVNKAHRHRIDAPHDLLGSLVLGTNMITPSWRHVVRLADLPWLRDHVVQSEIVFPGAGFICMAIEGSFQVAKNEGKRVLGYQLRDIEILLALMIPDTSDGVEVQLTIQPCSDKAIYATGWNEFHVYSVSAQSKWTQHCRGLIQVDAVAADDEISEWVPSTSATQQLAGWGDASDYRKSMNPKDVYAALQYTELRHGPIFQNLKSVKLNGSQSVIAFSVADTAATQPYQYQTKHIIDPTTLDSLFQAAYGGYIAMPQANMSTSFVPRLIKGLYVAHDIPREAGHKFKALCNIVGIGSGSFDADMVVVDDTDDSTKSRPYLKIDHYITQSLGNVRNKQTDAYDKLATVKWQPDISFITPEYLQQQLSPTDDTKTEIKTDLAQLCTQFIDKCLASLTRADISQLQSHHKKFYVWMKIQAASQSLSAGNIEYNTEETSNLIEKVKAASVNGEMVSRIGPHLIPILRREIDPSELMQEDDLLNRYQNESLGREHSDTQVKELVKHLAHKNPKAKYLEIGGGNGALTASILSVLGADIGPLASSYDVTHVLPDLTEAAEANFKEWADLVRCKTLDIEQDPAKQEFENNTYDVIIASQVSLTARNIDRAVANMRKLLKRGGTLLLVDTTQVPQDMILSLGVLPSWWIGEEEERKICPALSSNKWDDVLQRNRFSGIDTEIRDCQVDDLYSGSVIISTAIASVDPTYDSDVVIVTGTPTPPEYWLSQLKESLEAITDASVSVQSIEAVAEIEGKICIFLGEIGESLLTNPTLSQFEAIKTLCTRSKGLLWVTRGGVIDYENLDASLSQGFLRTVRTEYAGKRMITLDLDYKQELWAMKSLTILTEVFEHIFDYSNDNVVSDFEFAERDGMIHVPRYYKDVGRNNVVFPDPSKKVVAKLEPFLQADRQFRLNIGTSGLLDTLAFIDDPDASSDLSEDSLEITPQAFGANLRDVMVAMGMNETKYMGFECAGIVKRLGTSAASKGFKVGDRVATLMRGHYSNLVRVEWTNAIQIPDDMSFEVAATIPHSYTAAYICLYDIARIGKGDKILIHAAAGGLGQAAIALAKYAGAEIFITVGSKEKEDFAIESLGIRPDHIFSSRNGSFSPGVLAMTGGKGVDVVLNTLSGSLLQESFNCVAQFGRFIEVGKRDIELNNALEMGTFARNVSFSSVDLLQLEEHRGAQVSRVLNEVMDLFRQGVVQPANPITVHDLSDIQKTFRTIQAGKHMGKIVISVQPDVMVPVLPSNPSVTFADNASYLVVGGLGGIGRSVCLWMAEQGAKNLIILSRSANAQDKARSFIDEMARNGCKVYAVGCDISIESELAKALEACARDMPPIQGVIQGAMVLQDSILEQMTVEQYTAGVRPKVQGSWNLHKLLSKNQLEFFVMLSSLSGVVGLASQCNYAAGGTFQDALARYRTSRGLHGAAIDIGVVKAVGVVAENEAIAESLRRSGFKALSEDQVITAIQSAITSSPQTQMLIGLDGMDWEASGYNRDQRFAALIPHQSVQNTTNAGKAGAGELCSLIASASTFDEVVDVVVHGITLKLVDIFMIAEDEVDPSKAPRDYGVDSLSAVELRNMLALRAGAETSIFDIMQSASLTALAVVVATKSSHIDPSLLPQ